MKFFWIFLDSRTDEFSYNNFSNSTIDQFKYSHFVCLPVYHNWASKASPTLGCSIEISHDIYICRYVCMYVCCMSNHVESRESNTRMLKVSIGR